jgi:hypothetical protein
MARRVERSPTAAALENLRLRSLVLELKTIHDKNENGGLST